MSHDTCGHDSEERRNREAARWRMRLQESDLSVRQLLRFSKWQDSPENRAAFDALDPIWRAIQPPRQRIEPVSQQRTQPTKPVESKSQNVSYRVSERVRLVSEEAAYWYFLCVDDPSMLRSDGREFLAWMRKSPENIAELFKIAQLAGKLRRLKLAMRSLGLNKSNVVEFTISGSPYGLHREIKKLEDNEARDSVNKRTFTFKLAAFAASLFVGVALAFVAQDYMKSEQVVTTGVSQWLRMTLDDGTVVHLDANTKVQVAYTETERIVHIHSGDAVFEVTKDPKRPFIARTSLIDATAVGTRYGVSVGASVTTTVAEGVVKVTALGNVDAKAVTLQAGEELRVSDKSLASPQVASVDAERKLQWATGLLLLDGMTVAEGVEQLNRRNRTQIVVESPALGAKVIEFASIKVDEPERYARMIAADSRVTMIFDKENDVIRLSE